MNLDEPWEGHGPGPAWEASHRTALPRRMSLSPCVPTTPCSLVPLHDMRTSSVGQLLIPTADWDSGSESAPIKLIWPMTLNFLAPLALKFQNYSFSLD